MTPVKPVEIQCRRSAHGRDEREWSIVWVPAHQENGCLVVPRLPDLDAKFAGASGTNSVTPNPPAPSDVVPLMDGPAGTFTGRPRARPGVGIQLVAVDRAEDDGYRVVVIPTNIRVKLQGAIDITGAPIVDLGRFKEQWNESFSFVFVDPAKAERAVFEQSDAILALRGGRPPHVKEILISKTMRLGAAGYAEAAGVWEAAEGRIVIKREQLRSLSRYAGTLLHEIAYAETGTPDISAGFEDALTGELGEVATNSLTDG